MRTVIQRVNKASVTINQEIKSEIKKGLLILVGIENSDNDEDIEYLCNKISMLRIFDDENGIMNKAVTEIDGEILVVSQFTLFAQTKKGNRPSYIRASKSDFAVPIYEKFCRMLDSKISKKLQTGEFGSDMKIELLNDGPVTIIIDSKNKDF
ncbi:MAG: D-tyrosyl-tRNA(Tyr) deacylase [Prevotellaceae bacterium]|jgi:D-tyrosyl-tRNA(Tyr) deacylase|nr:D-tyrosyl-tRNA(Tyr) deacylase [Prevotellaceae bacterium]